MNTAEPRLASSLRNITITVNGEVRRFVPPLTVAQLLQQLDLAAIALSEGKLFKEQGLLKYQVAHLLIGYQQSLKTLCLIAIT